MRFDKLRLVGFKSFVEPTEFAILPGLTGIVGPNGCGKSNLVEALRWVMGETSYKSMRASGMEDVIFAGGGGRPARNTAEVVLTLDNSALTAPTPFNEAAVLEVTRRIGRDAGSTYRVNGREVRARDVQILFADASSGSRSPALVRQGQISEIIAAKPSARRRILEEAAGIAGLHGRRQEAELRLKGAADNLARIDDVLLQIAAQGDALRRQARQAARYRELQAALRRTRALQVLLEWEGAVRDDRCAAAELEAANAAVATTTCAQVAAARQQALAARDLPTRREAESAAAIRLQECIAALKMLDGEERRARGRLLNLEQSLRDMQAEMLRDTTTLDDAAASVSRLDGEEHELRTRDGAVSCGATLQSAVDQAEAARLDVEARLSDAQAERAEFEARRRSLDERARDEAARRARLERDLARLTQDCAAAAADLDDDGLDAAAVSLTATLAQVATAEAAARRAAAVLDDARTAETEAQTPLVEADRSMQRMETELRTLSRLLGAAGGGRWPPVAETLTVARGYETALGAALGDELDASLDHRASSRWIESDGDDDPVLPGGVASLMAKVEAPTALQRHLAQVGIAERDVIAALRPLLRPGQSLVTREGDLWRWDGFVRMAEAPSPAALRLVEKNRMAELGEAAAAARVDYEALRATTLEAQTRLARALEADVAAKDIAQLARRNADAARDAHDARARRTAGARSKLALSRERRSAIEMEHDEAVRRQAESAAACAASMPSHASVTVLHDLRAEAATRRTTELRARAALDGFLRDSELRERRLDAIGRERIAWRRRGEETAAHRAQTAERIAAADGERDALLAAPDRFVGMKRHLKAEVADAEAALRAAGDARARGEAFLAETERQARAALDAMGAAREARARCDARKEATVGRIDTVARTVAAEFDCAPADLSALAALASGQERPSPETVAARLDGLKADRDRLGAVNLRAEDELAAADLRAETLAAEKRDLDEAIGRLRQAIAGLNKEGRERLLRAFTTVDAHFRALFTGLFGGGEAELQLVEADDPLEAGLEIVARPPGKRPQVMSLLSGGEQALTALSLIFAVFLTNPSPICVLDEVDAPLDDSNVERFCDLLDDVRGRTDTRFIAITHNPITMARMDRLYGVTQIERGVSTLVGVDLAQAEALVDAS